MAQRHPMRVNSGLGQRQFNFDGDHSHCGATGIGRRDHHLDRAVVIHRDIAQNADVADCENRDLRIAHLIQNGAGVFQKRLPVFGV